MAAENKFVNFCPHTVTVLGGCFNCPALGCYVGGKEILSIPPSGTVATVVFDNAPRDSIAYGGTEIMRCAQTVRALTPSIPNEEGTWYIVPSLFATMAAARGEDTSHLLTPHGIVKDEKGRTVGCVGLRETRLRD